MKPTATEKLQRLEGRIDALAVMWLRMLHALDIEQSIDSEQIEDFLDLSADEMDLTLTAPDHSLSKQQYLRSLAAVARKARLKHQHSEDRDKNLSAVAANDSDASDGMD